MALNEIAKHFYEKEVERLLGLDDVKIIKEKFLDMRSQIDDLYVELGERARRIAELETELAVKEDLLKIKNGLCNEKSVIEILKSTPFVEDVLAEEPLPFSDEQYEGKIGKIEKAVLGIQAYLKKGTEQKIKELEEEQEKLRLEADYYRFWQETISPLKPKSEVHKVKWL